MGIKLTNNAVTTIPSAVSSVQTSLTVTTGTGALFPILGGGDYFYATLSDVNNNFEIVKVTARTDAIPFPANSRFELRVTVQNLLSKFDDLDFLLL
jgi:hypothetical protein